MSKNKKLSIALMLILCTFTLVGCSNKKENVNINQEQTQQEQAQQEQVESKIKYSEEFKKNYIELANTYNEIENFQELYNDIEWDEEKNVPVLSSDMKIKSLTNEEIMIDITSKLSDEEVRIYQLTNEVTEYYASLSVEDISEDEKLKLTEEIEEKSKEIDTLIEKYYENKKSKEEQDKTINRTMTTKCLLYGLVGGGEGVISLIDENMQGIQLLSSMMGMTGADMSENEYFNFIFDNMYLIEGENIYGKLIYNRNIDIENKTVTLTFGAKKYSSEMDKEIEEFKSKIEEFQQDYDEEIAE